MIEKTLLVDETFIKSVTNISDNIRSKLIEPAIFEAQNEDLREVLGDKLLNRLIDLVSSNDIYKEEYSNYKELLIKCQYFLAYTVASNICILTAVKIDNAGLYFFTIQDFIFKNLILFPTLFTLTCFPSFSSICWIFGEPYLFLLSL